jgi:PmbA protein
MNDDKFSYTKDQFKNITEFVLEQSISLGVSQAQVYISEDIGLSAEVRNATIEHCATNHDFSVSLTVFLDNKLGVVSANNVESADDVEKLVKQAIDIANYTQPDEANGLLESKYFSDDINCDLELYNSCDLNMEALIDSAKELEEMSMRSDARLVNSNGASISKSVGHFYLANTNGFNGGYKFSKYFKSASIIGQNDKGMQTDYWLSKSRDYYDLMSNSELSAIVSNRVIRRLHYGSIKPGKFTCIFENQVAKELIYSMLGALGGMTQYRKLSFLQDSLDQQILPAWFDILETPFLHKGLGSTYFDSEGFAVQNKQIITKGIVNTYLLSAYSARKLKMQPTGHADGVSNIIVKANFDGGIVEMAKLLKQGIIITETIGSGLNTVTGDYSVGASGLYVENGHILYFVDGITISSNIKDMLKNIIHVGNDYIEGSMQCGSIMIAEDIVSVNK